MARWLSTSVCLFLTACGIEPKTPQVVEEARDDPYSQVAAEAEVVQLAGGRDVEHVVPRHLEVDAGGWVQFVTLDRRVHTVSFVPDSLSVEGLEYLTETRQLVGPALLSQGSRFLVDFREAPAGRYVFSSQSHGEPVFGSVTVRDLPAEP